MKLRQTAQAVIAGALMLAGAPNLSASPIIGIGDGQPTSWQDALTAGNIQPVSGPLSPLAQAFYQQSVDESQTDPGIPDAFGFERSPVKELYAVDDLDINGQSFDSLVMTWDPPDPSPGSGTEDFLGIAAWQYVYDQDPDFTQAMVHFSIGPPLGAPHIWDLSLELVDVNGNVKSWFLSMPMAGWQNFWIKAYGGTQGPWMLMGQTPGFDITQVTAIQFDGAAFNGVMGFPPVPPPGVPAWDWLPFNHLYVTVPVPATLPLLGIGALVLLLLGRGGARRAAHAGSGTGKR